MILKFIDRNDELNALEKAYKNNRAEFYILYGRRRIGKSELLLHFIKDKPHFYFLAKEQNLKLEFARFKEKFSKKFDIYLESNDWEELFSEIARKIKVRIIIAIDEFSYWIVKDRSIISEFQYLWDEIIKNKNIFLIISGSYVSLMETEVLGYNSPLYGRRTGQLLIEPMGISCLKDFFPNYTVKDLINVYGCLDTVPYYLVQFDPKCGFWSNVQNVFLEKTNPLYHDAQIILSYELREPIVYFNIMRAILQGSTKLGEIANSAMVDITNMPKYLNRLIKLQMVRKTWPVTQPKEKRCLYELTDNYFRFWITYIFYYQEEIVDSPVQHLEYIKQTYSDYLGSTFERFCLKSLKKLMPQRFNKFGKWWYKDQEIDIIAMSDISKEIMFCECKWQDRVNANRVLNDLMSKSDEVRWHNKNRKSYFAIFARSFKEKIDKNNLILYDLDDLNNGLFA
ncbi:MAG: ATP-binding protein [Asgard group archaeon]|nr:ATP-binding protein [Asgard group archaeon]